MNIVLKPVALFAKTKVLHYKSILYENYRQKAACTNAITKRDTKKPHHIAYTDWGKPDNPHVIICVHGLTRNCRDFDFLATALSSDYRIICPDVVGRGQSDWLEDERDYDYYPLYLSDASALIAFIQSQYQVPITIDWVGISMGGLIGMMIAIQSEIRINKLVMSDIGPLIPAAALKRIAEYVGKDIRFDNLDEFEAYIRKISAPFGPLSDDQWRHLTIHSVRLLNDGTYGFCYDPKISASFRTYVLCEDIDLWQYWDMLQTPTLVIRGSNPMCCLLKQQQQCRKEVQRLN